MTASHRSRPSPLSSPTTSTTIGAVRDGRRRRWLALLALVALVVATGAVAADAARPATVLGATGCRIYVAAGDDLAAGKDLGDNAKRYPDRLLADHLHPTAWCLFNQAKNGQTSSSFITGGGLAMAYNMRPDLITIQLGEQNSTVVNLIKDCFDKVKDHDFAGANTCAASVLANSSVWTNLRNNYTTILQMTRIMQAQRPKLVVAVVNYPNPYPHADTAAASIAELCTPLIDTIPTCLARWVLLPPALILLDQAIAKLNQTLKDAMAPFQQGPSGNRWVYVDAAPLLKDHCMEMKVTIKTKVEHPEEEGAVHEHDSPEVNFGCDESWYTAGSDGTKSPDYLDPAAIGILIAKSQTTKGMGVYPNADGHTCIDNAIWEADTIDPGTTPLKWKLAYGEPADTSVCE